MRRRTEKDCFRLCVAAFGSIGFIVADALISIGSYLLIYAILRSITEKKAMAATIALAIILAMYDHYYAGGWNFRYPRPYVTQGGNIRRRRRPRTEQ